MSELKRILYFNSLFDLELGKFPVNKVQQSGAEMTVLFAPLGSRHDRILLDIDVPDEYWNYLDTCGLNTPQPIAGKKTKDCYGFEGEAWGWNKKSLDRLSNTGAKCFSSEFDVIEKVNSRCFSNHIAKKYELGVSGSKYSCNPYEYKNILLALKNEFPLVIKPAYGGSGFGFRKIESPNLSDDYFRDIAFLSEHGGYVIEPWYKRVYDLSTRVEIDQNGSVSLLRHLRPYVNVFGAFYGIYLSPQDQVLEKYDEILEKTAMNFSKELYSAGYWGPAGLDSFVYKDLSDSCLKIASGIEVNARHVMSDIVFALRDSCAPGKHCFFRFISRKKGFVPDNYKCLNDMLGSETYNPITKTGIMLVSPLLIFYGNNWVKPSRNVFFISADSKTELFNRDNFLRELLRKTV